MLRLVAHPFYHDNLWEDLESAFTWPIFEREKRPALWSTAVELHGYRPEEINTKRETSKDGKELLTIHARHVNGDDYNELKRTVNLPDNIEIEQLKLHFSKKGILLIQAPYKREEKKTALSIFDDFDSECFGSMLGRTQILPAENGGEIFQADFAVSGFKPEEINVQQRENQIIVEAKQKQHSEESTSLKEMRRSVTVPHGVKLDQFTSQYNESEGLLRLVAPYEKPSQPALQSRQIPLQISDKSLKPNQNQPMES